MDVCCSAWERVAFFAALFTIPPPCMGSAAVGKTVRGFAETGYDTEPDAAAKSGISPLGALLVRLLRDGRFGYYNA